MLLRKGVVQEVHPSELHLKVHDDDGGGGGVVRHVAAVPMEMLLPGAYVFARTH